MKTLVLFLKANYKDRPGYWLGLGPHGKRRWMRIAFGQRAGLFDLPDMPVVPLTGREITVESRPWAMREAVKAFAQRYRGQSFVNRDTGHRLAISKEGYRHLFGGDKTKAELQSVAALPRLIENAVLADVHPDRKNETQLLQVWRLFSAVSIAGKTHRVKLTVKVRKDGLHQFHELDALEIGDPAVNAREVVTASGSTPYHERPAGSAISITDLLRGATRDHDGRPFAPMPAP